MGVMTRILLNSLLSLKLMQEVCNWVQDPHDILFRGFSPSTPEWGMLQNSWRHCVAKLLPVPSGTSSMSRTFYFHSPPNSDGKRSTRSWRTDGLVEEGPERLDLGRELGQAKVDDLVVQDGAPEGAALPRVLDRLPDAFFHGSERQGHAGQPLLLELQWKSHFAPINGLEELFMPWFARTICSRKNVLHYEYKCWAVETSTCILLCNQIIREVKGTRQLQVICSHLRAKWMQNSWVKMGHFLSECFFGKVYYPLEIFQIL